MRVQPSGEVEVKGIKTAVISSYLSDFDVTTWLPSQKAPYKWLLAHTYQGVIWGRRDPDGWQLSSRLIPNSPPLETHTLLELRLFAETAELYIWRDGTTFRQRIIQDDSGSNYGFYDEPCLLWGTKGQNLDHTFCQLEDGSQGLAHAVPLPLGSFDAGNVRLVSLIVRQYVERDPGTGLARVVMSRLVDLAYDQKKLTEVKNGTHA